MPFSAKLIATAPVTGTVAANTAIGSEKASMLETATTSSITNSMKVPVFSDTPIGCTRLNIQARPKNRSSMHEADAPRLEVHLELAASPGIGGIW